MIPVSTMDLASQIAGVPISDIRGSDRRSELCMIRWAVMTALRAKGHSFVAIGRILNRDHSTVVHGLRRAADCAQRDPDFARFVEAIR